MYDFMDHLLILNEFVPLGQRNREFKQKLVNQGIDPNRFTREIYTNQYAPEQFDQLQRDPNYFSPREIRKYSRSTRRNPEYMTWREKDNLDAAKTIYYHDGRKKQYFNAVRDDMINPNDLYKSSYVYGTRSIFAPNVNRYKYESNDDGSTKRVLDKQAFHQNMRNAANQIVDDYNIPENIKKTLYRPNGTLDMRKVRKLVKQHNSTVLRRNGINQKDINTVVRNNEILKNLDTLGSHRFNTKNDQMLRFNTNDMALLGKEYDSTLSHERRHNRQYNLLYDLYGQNGVDEIHKAHRNSNYITDALEHDANRAEIGRPFSNDQLKSMLTNYMQGDTKSTNPGEAKSIRKIKFNKPIFAIRNNIVDSINNHIKEHPTERITPLLYDITTLKEIDKYNKQNPQNQIQYNYSNNIKPYVKLTNSPTSN